MKRITLGSALLLAGSVALALAGPVAASAHVTIGTEQADPGSYPVIDFKVPTESATASTSRIAITLPQDTPFSFVAYVPVAGWSAELVRESAEDPVTEVIWTADPGSEITPEQYGVFPVLLGGVPDTGSVVLPVEQTYTDGTVVDWAETGDDAEYPAPVLYVTDAPPAGGHHAAGPDLAVGGDAAAPVDVLARVLGGLGLVLGAGGIAFGLASRRRAKVDA